MNLCSSVVGKRFQAKMGLLFLNNKWKQAPTAKGKVQKWTRDHHTDQAGRIALLSIYKHKDTTLYYI